jgi:hypothetical protein
MADAEPGHVFGQISGGVELEILVELKAVCRPRNGDAPGGCQG